MSGDRLSDDGLSDDGPPAAIWPRLAWFVLLWAGGVAAVTAVGLLIRLVLKP